MAERCCFSCLVAINTRKFNWISFHKISFHNETNSVQKTSQNFVTNMNLLPFRLLLWNCRVRFWGKTVSESILMWQHQLKKPVCEIPASWPKMYVQQKFEPLLLPLCSMQWILWLNLWSNPKSCREVNIPRKAQTVLFTARDHPYSNLNARRCFKILDKHIGTQILKQWWRHQRS